MATPTPSGSKKPAGSVSTPSHLNQFSPPRSVPSPLTARHPAGKTPMNHPTTGSSSGSKTLAGTPMVQNLSQGGNTSSPSAGTLGHLTPSGLGIEGLTPSGLHGLTPAMSGGAQMMQSMSDFGLASSAKRNEDEERRAKMRSVLKKIGVDKGRASEEGIARAARRVGFANDIDAEKLTPEEKERKVGNRPITIAGNAIVIEVDLKNQIPRGVQVMYSTQSKALEDHGAKAGQVLLNDLSAPDGIALNAKLDRFATNLERLAKMDRLSTPTINCFEAISGLHASLERLYQQERDMVRKLLPAGTATSDNEVEIEVVCKKSGKPLVHANGKLGFEIAYWQDSRYVDVKAEARHKNDEMDIDGPSEQHKPTDDLQGQVFKLRLEVEPIQGTIYPSLRISDEWLPDPLDLSNIEPGETIPWRDPLPTFADGNMLDGQLPNLRFVAILDPPLVVPQVTAMNISNLVGAPSYYTTHQQYAAMLLRPSEVPLDPHLPQPLFETSSSHLVLPQNDEKAPVQYCFDLQNTRLDHGIRIDQLPFSHPSQLVELLPTLRQWACMGSLLKTTIDSDHANNKSSDERQPAHAQDTRSISSALDTLLMDDDSEQNSRAVQVTIELATTPMPTLKILFARDSGEFASMSIEVQANADPAVTLLDWTSYNQPSITFEEMQQREKLLAKTLDYSGDLGIWVEWLKTNSNLPDTTRNTPSAPSQTTSIAT